MGDDADRSAGEVAGRLVTVRGRVSTTVLRRGQTVAGVEVTPFLQSLADGGWVDILPYGEGV